MRYNGDLRVNAQLRFYNKEPLSIGLAVVGTLTDTKTLIHQFGTPVLAPLLRNVVTAISWSPFPLPNKKSSREWLANLTTDFPGRGFAVTLLGVSLQISFGNNRPKPRAA